METEKTLNEKPKQELTITDMAAGYINETRKWASSSHPRLYWSGVNCHHGYFRRFHVLWHDWRRRDRGYCALLLMALLYFFPSLCPFRFSEVK